MDKWLDKRSLSSKPDVGPWKVLQYGLDHNSQFTKVGGLKGAALYRAVFFKIKDHLWSFRIMSDHFGIFGLFWDHLASFKIILHHFASFAIILHHFASFCIMKDHVKLFLIFKAFLAIFCPDYCPFLRSFTDNQDHLGSIRLFLLIIWSRLIMMHHLGSFGQI